MNTPTTGPVMQTVDKKRSKNIVIGGEPLELSHINDVGLGTGRVRLTDDQDRLQRLQSAAALVQRAVDEGWPVYGITTGFGGMANVPVSSELAAASQNNLLTFLATGAGAAIDRRHVRSAMALRAHVLMQGRSGVRYEIIERLVHFLNADATPVVRELGSIGASGDLVPLATIARAVTGNSRRVSIQLADRVVDGQTALQELGLKPIDLRPKEGLAMVNGTSFSSAIAANCIGEARTLMAIAMAAQSMMLRALNVQTEPFEEFVHQCKPHPGQLWVARMMLRLLQADNVSSNGAQRNGKAGDVQDRYSLRCLPQYMGPIAEGLARIAKVVETEMNSISDNPLVDTDAGRFYQSGNFLGQYIGMAMDDLRRYIGLMAKHLDVQIASLVAPEFSRGLPMSLRGNDQLAYNMGLKGLQITGNSIMPMLTYLGNSLVEHFPTHAEQFNQNINGLSWGSANLAWKSIELFRHYLSVAVIFSVQALDLRAQSAWGHFDGRASLGPITQPIYEAIYAAMNCQPGKTRPFLFDDSDQWLEEKLDALYHNIGSDDSIVHTVSPILGSFERSHLGS